MSKKTKKFRFWTNDNKPFIASLHYFILNDGTKEKVLPDNISPFKPIQEFTSIKDFDGKEIFTGDIVNVKIDNHEYTGDIANIIAEVYLKNGQYRLLEKSGTSISLYDMVDCHKVCVIGNNIQNKDLL